MTAPDPVRAGRALNGAAAAMLVLEGLAVLFVPRAIAVTGEGLGAVRLTVLLVLALVLILASGAMRRPGGLAIGTALQVPLLLTGFYSSAMWFVGALFAALWAYLLKVRRELIGTALGPAPTAPPAGPQPPT